MACNGFRYKRKEDRHWNADLRRLTKIAVMPRSATSSQTPLLVLFGNRIRTLRLVPQQPKALPYVSRNNALQWVCREIVCVRAWVL
jgi:hypothetical protein